MTRRISGTSRIIRFTVVAALVAPMLAACGGGGGAPVVNLYGGASGGGFAKNLADRTAAPGGQSLGGARRGGLGKVPGRLQRRRRRPVQDRRQPAAQRRRRSARAVRP